MEKVGNIRMMRMQRVRKTALARVVTVMTMRAFSAAGAIVNAAITGFTQNSLDSTLNMKYKMF